jgi:hypothetical protein
MTKIVGSGYISQRQGSPDPDSLFKMSRIRNIAFWTGCLSKVVTYFLGVSNDIFSLLDVDF